MSLNLSSSSMPKGRLIMIGAGVLIILVVVFGFLGIIPLFKDTNTTTDPNFPTTKVDLVLWGTEPQIAFAGAIKAYQDQHKNVQVKYTQFSDEGAYETALINALAQGKGPDVFMVKNLWNNKYRGIMAPAYTALVTQQMITSLFPSVVLNDFVYQGNVYASPLSLDALVLYYNKDLFNTSALLTPPATWDEVISDSARIRQLTASKAITQAGIALGETKNISRFADIIGTLMMQSGAKINVASSTAVKFDDSAQKAVNFYAQFAQSANTNYTWDQHFSSSREAFVQGLVGMVVDYETLRSDIKKKNPFFNFGVTLLPQISGSLASQKTTFANYWGLAVSQQSPNRYVGWDFVKSATMNPPVSSQYLSATGKLPALNSLIQKEFGGDNDVFARSFLIAKTWQEPDPKIVDSAFSTMIQDVVSGKSDSRQAAAAAATIINTAASL